MVVVFLRFGGTALLFSKVAYHFTFPSIVCKCYSFSTFLQTVVIFFLFFWFTLVPCMCDSVSFYVYILFHIVLGYTEWTRPVFSQLAGPYNSAGVRFLAPGLLNQNLQAWRCMCLTSIPGNSYNQAKLRNTD